MAQQKARKRAKGRGRGESLHSKRRIQAKERQAKALIMRRSGASYQVIADALGFSDPAAAFNAIDAALKATLREPADELRALELARLDAMHETLWLAVEDPENCPTLGPAPKPGEFKSPGGYLQARMGWECARLGCIEKLLKIQERRSRLLGLDAPKRLDPDDQANVAERLRRMLREAEELHPEAAEAGS